MIPATHENLVRAYEAHKEVAKNGELLSHKLIKVYAAECAVKACYLKKNGEKDTKKIAKKLQSYGHDFHFWLKAINAPRFLKETPGTENGFAISDLHQRLRYGIPIPVEVEIAQMKFIQGIIDKIGKQI
jgi:hypothetical protein